MYLVLIKALLFLLLISAPRLATRLVATWLDFGAATEIGGDSMGHLWATFYAVPVLPGGGHCQFASAACAEHFQYFNICGVRLVRLVHGGSRAVLSFCKGKSTDCRCKHLTHYIWMPHTRRFWGMPQVHFRHSNPFNAVRRQANHIPVAQPEPRPHANTGRDNAWKSVRFQFRMGHNFGSCLAAGWWLVVAGASVCVSLKKFACYKCQTAKITKRIGKRNGRAAIVGKTNH